MKRRIVVVSLATLILAYALLIAAMLKGVDR